MNDATRQRIALCCRVFVGALLFLAAMLKVAHLSEFDRVTATFTWLPLNLRQQLPLLVPVAELTCAYLLCVTRGRLGHYLTTGLLLVFTGYLVSQAVHPYAPHCECLGLLTLAEDARVAIKLGIGRNCVLIFMLAVARWLGPATDAANNNVLRVHRGVPSHQKMPAFTLLETLVVVGLITALFGLTLSTASKLKRSAERTRCQATLRTLGQSLNVLASQKNGFTLLAGDCVFTDPPGVNGLASALGDPTGLHYRYWTDEPIYPLPWHAQVAPFPFNFSNSGRPDRTINSGREWEDFSVRHPELKTYACPSLKDPPEFMSGPTLNYVTPRVHYQTPYRSWTGYALNGEVFGFDGIGRRMRGRITAIKHPAEIVLAGDADVAKPRFPSVVWFAPTNVPRTSLHDVLIGPAEIYGIAPDRARHVARLNLLFADGHVETRTQDDLRTAYLR